MFQRHKARPDQAGFFRRFTAFMVDSFIIMFISTIIFFAYSEITAAHRGEKGEFSRLQSALKKGEPVVIGLSKTHQLSEPEKASNQSKKTYVIGGEMFNIIKEFL